MTMFYTDIAQQDVSQQAGKRLIGLLLSGLLLSGCMGAPLAQQLLSSAVIQSTDNIMNNAYEAQQREMRTHRTLQDSLPDEYWNSFISSGFQKIMPIAEPLPSTGQTPAPQAIKTSTLLRIEVWNMLVGEEKIAVLEQALLAGNAHLPPQSEWETTYVASGAQADDDEPIVFLIPPTFGRLNSGQQVTVELSDTGILGIARYATTNARLTD